MSVSGRITLDAAEVHADNGNAENVGTDGARRGDKLVATLETVIAGLPQR